jgi:hypothetical protein
LVGPRIRNSLVGPVVNKVRAVLWGEYPLSSVTGLPYLAADPAINDGVPMRRREATRQLFAHSIRVPSNVRMFGARSTRLCY